MKRYHILICTLLLALVLGCRTQRDPRPTAGSHCYLQRMKIGMSHEEVDGVFEAFGVDPTGSLFQKPNGMRSESLILYRMYPCIIKGTTNDFGAYFLAFTNGVLANGAKIDLETYEQMLEQPAAPLQSEGAPSD